MTLDHLGLLYRNSHEYLTGMTGFVREAVAAGDAVLVAVPGPDVAVFRGALADVNGVVSFTDMAEAGRNPGRIIPGVLLAFAAAHPGRRTSIVGESLWPGRTALEQPACFQHEALINAVFAERDTTILCAYDATRLDGSVLADAWRTHPAMIVDGVRRGSGSYADPIAAAARFNQPLPGAPERCARFAYAAPTDLGRVRRFVAEHAAKAGLAETRIEDLVTAVNELAENTLVHTGGGGAVTVWADGGQFVCRITDAGHLTDPLAGRIPPSSRTEGGRGLLLAHHLCDLVRVHTTPDGTMFQLYMDAGIGAAP
ncbi:anti-sigma regulatory factor [Actinoplanes italicus]|uniref:Anti-sigma regulatory factor (Ser/Thr protein kinase) n=1 Tax=Actinoplanes italicus TaxID=113567 RepID=A0A2T0K2R8_9ACTN|nr:sensor histidine kinase [Actinoplanes italicus]PRX16910.1 anti-sigma regulatory factor (Ser/Thr protein kinase) [Actinoplanes italicus]GIE30957.1 anti-sigma regulatory factor [Actinoplanes italicus]